MGDIVSCHVVPVHLQILVGTGGAALDVQNHLFDVVDKDVVVENSFHCRCRTTAARSNEEAADVVGHIVVVEEDVTGVLNIQKDSRLAGREVSVKILAVASELISCHCYDWIHLASAGIFHCAPPVVFDDRET